MTQITPHLHQLYNRDFVIWCEETVAQLKAQKFDDLDLEHLIEEIEGLVKRERRELKNRLDVLLNPLLKRCYVPTPENYRGWELTIREQRKQLQRLLEDSPSLRSYWLDVFDSMWQSALADARQDYPAIQFPDTWPFSRNVENLLTETFWQSANNE